MKKNIRTQLRWAIGLYMLSLSIFCVMYWSLPYQDFEVLSLIPVFGMFAAAWPAIQLYVAIRIGHKRLVRCVLYEELLECVWWMQYVRLLWLRIFFYDEHPRVRNRHAQVKELHADLYALRHAK